MRAAARWPEAGRTVFTGTRASSPPTVRTLDNNRGIRRNTMDYKQLAAVILQKVGGKENVDKVLHCATRLRFTLKDVSKADTEALKKTKGVMSVIHAGGQYQVVIGPDVPQVYQEVVALGNFEIAKPVDARSE